MNAVDVNALREFAWESIGHGRSHMLPPQTMIALLDRLEAAEAEVLEQARLLGIGGEKELALMAKLEAAEKDAARYRWLREQHWSTDVIGVLVRPKTHSHLGSIFPSLKLLDDTIDHMMEKLK